MYEHNRNLHKYGLAYKHAPQIKKQVTAVRQPSFSLAQTTRHTTSNKFSFQPSAYADPSLPQTKDDQQVTNTRRELLPQLALNLLKNNQNKQSSLAIENQLILFESADVDRAFNRQRRADNDTLDKDKNKAITSEEKFQSVIKLTAAVFRFGLFLANDQSFMSDLIRSGFVWRAFRFLMFSTQRDLLFYFPKVD